MSAHVLLWTFGFVKDWREGEYCWWQRMDTAVVGWVERRKRRERRRERRGSRARE